MNKLFVFNAGHEEALKVPIKQNYTPSKEILKIRQDLASLMLYFAKEGDYVWIWGNEEKTDRLVSYRGDEVEDYRSLPRLKVYPWALDGHLFKELEHKAKILGLEVEFPKLSEAYLKLSHRSSAALILEYLSKHWQDCSQLTPQWFYPKADWELMQEELDSYLRIKEKEGIQNLLMKRAYTSSGRGLSPLTLPQSQESQTHLLLQMRRWGGFSLEEKLEVVEDWAIEYHINEEGEVSFVALSKFKTNSFGAYQGNILKPQSKLYAELEEILDDKLSKLIDCHKDFFGQHLKTVYNGYVGVDMFVYKTTEGILKLHPCVEINLRCTMGLVAHLVYEQEKDKTLDKCSDTTTFQVDYLRESWQDIQRSRQGKVKLLNELRETSSFVAFISWD